MRVIGGKRGSGKTTELIRECNRLNKRNAMPTYIVCANRERELALKGTAVHLLEDIPPTMTFGEFIRREWYGDGIHGFIFDDLDACLESISGRTLILSATVGY